MRTLPLYALCLAFLALIWIDHRTLTVEAQPSNRPTAYDCLTVFSFTGNITGTGIRNDSSSAPCVSWRVTYTSAGFARATVYFETSPDNVTFTAPPDTLCSATVSSPCVTDGNSPIAPAVMGLAAYRAYGKYIRIRVTGVSGTGSGQVVAYGYKGIVGLVQP